MVNKEATESLPNITSYIENKQNSLAGITEEAESSQWLITALLDAMGEMASVVLQPFGEAGNDKRCLFPLTK